MRSPSLAAIDPSYPSITEVHYVHVHAALGPWVGSSAENRTIRLDPMPDVTNLSPQACSVSTGTRTPPAARSHCPKSDAKRPRGCFELALSLSRITAFGCIDELGSVSTGLGLARGAGKSQLLIGGHHILQIGLGDCRLTVQVLATVS